MPVPLFHQNDHGDTWQEPELATADGRSIDQSYCMPPAIVSALEALAQLVVDEHEHAPAGLVMATVFGLKRSSTCACGADLVRYPPGSWTLA